MSDQLSCPNLVLFDWDGTLADNHSLITDAHNHVRAFYNLPLWSDEDARKNIRLSARDYYAEQFDSQERANEAMKLFFSYVENNHIDALRAISGAEDFLRFLMSHDISMGIVSNKSQRFLDREIESLNWQDFFSCVIGGDVTDKGKPDPEPIFHALERLKIGRHSREQEIWYIGDTETDMQAASAASILPVFIEHGLSLASELDPAINVVKVQDFIQLSGLIVPLSIEGVKKA